eukprot:m.9088 g.9088  ORF g.9088 m.9088 type:complete len:492 (+) comp4007_c0_seq1:339-1814(+)
MEESTYTVILVGSIVCLVLLVVLVAMCLYMSSLASKVANIQKRGQRAFASPYFTNGTPITTSPPGGFPPAASPAPMVMNPSSMPVTETGIGGAPLSTVHESPLDDVIKKEADKMWAELQQEEKERAQMASTAGSDNATATLGEAEPQDAENKLFERNSVVTVADTMPASSNHSSEDESTKEDTGMESNDDKIENAELGNSNQSNNMSPRPSEATSADAEKELEALFESAHGGNNDVDQLEPVENAIKLRRSLRMQADEEERAENENEKKLLEQEAEDAKRREQEYENRMNQEEVDKEQRERTERATQELEEQEKQLDAARSGYLLSQAPTPDKKQGNDEKYVLTESQQRIQQMRSEAAGRQSPALAAVVEDEKEPDDHDKAKQLEQDIDRIMREKAAARRRQDEERRIAAKEERERKRKEEEEARIAAELEARRREEEERQAREERERIEKEQREKEEQERIALMSPGQRRIYEEHLAQARREEEFRKDRM